MGCEGFAEIVSLRQILESAGEGFVLKCTLESKFDHNYVPLVQILLGNVGEEVFGSPAGAFQIPLNASSKVLSRSGDIDCFRI